MSWTILRPIFLGTGSGLYQRETRTERFANSQAISAPYCKRNRGIIIYQARNPVNIKQKIVGAAPIGFIKLDVVAAHHDALDIYVCHLLCE